MPFSTDFCKDVVRDFSLKDALFFAAFVVTGLLVADLVWNFAQLPAFRHDELKYWPGGYLDKLSTEGRWINYLCYEVLKRLNVPLCACVSLGCFFLFCFRCLANILDRRWAVLMALVCLCIPPAHLLNEWAQTCVLSCIILAAASFCANTMKRPIFFLLFGVLFNGMLSHCYFLLPLLFLGENNRADWRLLLWWMAGFIAGYAVAEAVTWVVCGSLIQLESWREPHYMHGLSDLAANMARALKDIARNLGYFGVPALCLAGLSAVLFGVEIARRRAALMAALVLFMVACSIFAMGLPAGLYTATRSAACLFLAVIVLCCLALRRLPVVLTLTAVLLAGQFYVHNMHNITYMGVILRTWQDDLATIPVVPSSLRGLVIVAEEDKFFVSADTIAANAHARLSSTEELGMSRRWRPVALELGYGTVLFEGEAERFANEPARAEQLKAAEWRETSLYRWTIADGWLFLDLR